MPAKKHNFTRTEIMAGLLVLVSGAVLAGFIAVIQGVRPPQEANVYYAGFTNTIGLKPGAEVRFGGMLAGRVAEVAPDPDDHTRLRVAANVDPGIPINEASVATVEQLTLTSDKHLELSTGKADSELLPPGSMLQSVTQSGDFIDIPDVTGVVNRVENLLDDVIAFLGVDDARKLEAEGGPEFAKLSKITADVRGTLEEGTGLLTDMRGTLEEQKPNIEAIVRKVTELEDGAQELIGELNGALAENRAPIHDTITGVQAAVGDARKAMGGVNAVVADVGKIVSGVSDDLETLLATLQRTLDNAEGLSGNARAFLEANRPEIEDLLYDLGVTLGNLKDFSKVLAEQPQAVIRGRTPEGRKE